MCGPRLVAARIQSNESSCEYFSRALDACLATGKSQKAVAIDAGFDKPNNISNFKSGATPIPIDRVCDLAFALEGFLDQHALLAKVLEERFKDSGLQAIAEMVLAYGTERRFKSVLDVVESCENEVGTYFPASLTDEQRAVLRNAFLEVVRLETVYEAAA